MTFGISGAHRTGKSTLAERISDETGMALVLTPVSDIFKRNGIDPSKPMSFAERLSIQHKILDGLVERWREEGGYFVSDRTPLDMMAYTLADVTGAVGVHDIEKLQAYMTRCFEVTNTYFSTILVIQPGIEIVDDPTKATAALNRSYMEHLNSLVFGLAYDERCKAATYYIRRDQTDMVDRVNGAIFALRKAAARHAGHAMTIH